MTRITLKETVVEIIAVFITIPAIIAVAALILFAFFSLTTNPTNALFAIMLAAAIAIPVRWGVPRLLDLGERL